MRVLCLWLPNWPAQRLRVLESADRNRPVILHASIRNARRVVSLTSGAARHGVRLEMPLAEAESLLAECDPLLGELDAPADCEELKRLAVLAGQFGPVTGIEEGESPESLFIDVTGCAVHFGGEWELASQAMRFLSEQGYAARAGLADTIGLAWAACRCPTRERIVLVSSGNGEHWLSERPIRDLRLDLATRERLGRLGLRTVGDVSRLPRTELPVRFGALLLQRLDQALGITEESIIPIRPAEPLRLRWSTEIPLTDSMAVLIILGRLIEQLLHRLPRWEGVTGLVGQFDANASLRVGVASPTRSAERLMALFRLVLEREPPPREVSHVDLLAETVRMPVPERLSLFDDRSDAERENSFRRLVERLGNRLGAESVARPLATRDPLPERAFCFHPATVPPKGGAGSQPVERAPESVAACTRPILLLPEPKQVDVLALYPDGPPRQITLRGRAWPLVLALGPERLETSWARHTEARRDYWRVETEEGERLWLFRCRRSGGWFLHGLFG